jgi:hypothetical protein
MSNQHPIHKLSSQATGNKSNILLPRHIQMIDEALRSLGEYGEVRLVVEKGTLRFLVTQKSYDTFEWQPGGIVKDLES